MKPRYTIDYAGLEAYLLSTKRSEIETAYQTPENPKLQSATTELWVSTYGKSSEKPVVAFGEPFLVDALGGELSIVMHTKRKYRLQDGRAIHGIFDRKIISDTRAQYGNPLNGIWKIPSQFLTKLGKS